MVHPLYWPGVYYFYPIGNTSAVCFTGDISPEEDANTLLLGCGDPRNILYTVFCEPESRNRTLDFTCCDMEPAVLARNLLLFTMIADRESSMNVIWNIFFHIYLDHDSSIVLSAQCEKLIACSTSLENWSASPYGGFIKMSTEYTLVEIRRHWNLWLDMKDLPRARSEAIYHAFESEMAKRSLSRKGDLVYSSARSAGPSFLEALAIMSEQFAAYWRTGVTFVHAAEISSATLINPTFVYSLAGEGFHVHYGTDPLVPFHFASTFGNARSSLSIADIVDAAKAELTEWCLAFNSALSSTVPPVVRFFLGEVTAVCRVLHTFALTGTTESDVPVGRWKAQSIHLNRNEYVDGDAPINFNVIDTSNLVDHIGLLNVLTSSIPLLNEITGSGVLYTEFLLPCGDDVTKGFADSLRADLVTTTILMGLCPVDSLSGFTTRCNTHEVLISAGADHDPRQFHQSIAWKSSTSRDAVAVRMGRLQPLSFDPVQLGTFLYNMYHRTFEGEDAMTFWRLNRKSIHKAIADSNIVHNTRESFVLFLKLIKDRARIADQTWIAVMKTFSALQSADKSVPMDANHCQDLYAQLHRHGVYTVFWIHNQPSKTNVLSSWTAVPSLLRIFLTVPRKRLAALAESLTRRGTPPFQCHIAGKWSHSIFSSLYAAFGKVSKGVTNGYPRVILEEDPEGWAGTSPLVVSFTIPSSLFGAEPPEDLQASFCVQSTASTAVLAPQLGLMLTIYSAQLVDESAVLMSPEYLVLPLSCCKSTPSLSALAVPQAQIGSVGVATIALDKRCASIATMTLKVTVEQNDAKCLFQNGAKPEIVQIAPCTILLSIGSYHEVLVFPAPIIGGHHKLLLARKSLYIEVIVPISGPMSPGSMVIGPFPFTFDSNAQPRLWNIHRLNLSRLPVLDTGATKLPNWLNPHFGSMMSMREVSLKNKHQDDTLMYLKDTLHAIFVLSSGIQKGPPRRLFALREAATKSCDTIFFISDLKYDLQSHVVICDGYVLPLTKDLMSKIVRPFSKLVSEGALTDIAVFNGEMEGWKRLMPALTERCRTSWKHGDKCEYKLQEMIPLSLERGADPLCSCGRGMETGGMAKADLWKPFMPYVTRIALSPLFAVTVTYIESVLRAAVDCCSECGKEGKPKLMVCSGCKIAKYCSPACQTKNWRVHKRVCRS